MIHADRNYQLNNFKLNTDEAVRNKISNAELIPESNESETCIIKVSKEDIIKLINDANLYETKFAQINSEHNENCGIAEQEELTLGFWQLGNNLVNFIEKILNEHGYGALNQSEHIFIHMPELINDIVNWMLNENMQNCSEDEMKNKIQETLTEKDTYNMYNFGFPSNNDIDNINNNFEPDESLKDLLDKMINASPDNDVNVEDFLVQFKKESAEYVTNKYGYSNDYAELIISFIINTVDSETNYDDLNFENISKYFIRLLNDLNFLDTGLTNGELISYSNFGEIGYAYGVTPNEGYYDGYRVSGIIYGDINDGEPYNGLFFQFIMQHINEMFDFNFTSAQLKALYSRIFNAFAGTEALSFNNSLDKDNDGSWFNDFYEIVLEETAKIQKVDMYSAQSINIETLFEGYENGLSAQDLINNQDNMLLSNDAGIRLLITQLLDVSDNLGISNRLDYEDLINAFIKLINNKCGIENTNPPILNKNAFKQFMNSHSIQELNDFLKSDELRNAFYMETIDVNAELENFSQGHTGDCWLLAGLIALKNSPYGIEIIRNAIHDNGDGTYTVTLKGSYVNGIMTANEVSYTITAAELYNAKGWYYSSGDDDVILLELAISKLCEENNIIRYGNVGDPHLAGGHQYEIIHYLTGNGGYEEKATYEMLMEALHNGTLENYAIYFSLLGSNQFITTVDGKIFGYDLVGNAHAFAITKVTETTVTIVNPWNSSVEYEITWEDFFNLNFCPGGSLHWVDLSELV